MDNNLLKQLIVRHRRVVIPDFGAFLKKETPEGEALVFSPFLRKDDGVVTNAIVREYGVETEDARAMVAEFVIYLRQSLASSGKYYIEGVGMLMADANGAITLREGEFPAAAQPAAAAAEAEMQQQVQQPQQPSVVPQPTPVVQPVMPQPQQQPQLQQQPMAPQPQPLVQQIQQQIPPQQPAMTRPQTIQMQGQAPQMSVPPLGHPQQQPMAGFGRVQQPQQPFGRPQPQQRPQGPMGGGQLQQPQQPMQPQQRPSQPMQQPQRPQGQPQQGMMGGGQLPPRPQGPMGGGQSQPHPMQQPQQRPPHPMQQPQQRPQGQHPAGKPGQPHRRPGAPRRRPPKTKTDVWLVVAIIAALVVIAIMIYGFINTGQGEIDMEFMNEAMSPMDVGTGGMETSAAEDL